LGRVGVKIEAEKRAAHEVGPPLKLTARGGPDERTDSARLLLARNSSGFLAARVLIADALASRASAIMLDYTPQGVGVRTMVDGVWIARPTQQREAADPALESLKMLCGLNPKDRQSRQAGLFAGEYESAKLAVNFASQGTAGGERVLIQFEEKKVRFDTFDDLGLRTKLQEQLRELLNLPKGLVLFSAAPGNGLRSTMDVALRACDRFVREFISVEEENTLYQTVENVAVSTYSAAEGQTPDDVLMKVFRTEPNVVIVRDLVNAETVRLLCQQIAKDRLMIGTVRANDCAEALLRVLALGVPPAEFGPSISGVICQRLVRKLCDACKEAYAPTPQVLQQLGIPEGRVQAFYRPPQPKPEEPKEPCAVCGGIGYFGRTALFEVLTVGDVVRKSLAAGAKLDVVRRAARKDGLKNFQEEGILLVARGVTSLPELMRVLKQ
jgi:type II secretory ATPase GspE/PulE/Tfp pilus assembly ATPase PilB-like protein